MIQALFTLPTEASVLPMFQMKFWYERVDSAAHLELRRFSYSGWKRWISDPDLTLRRMKRNVNRLLWGISRSGARSEVKDRLNSNSAMLNDGRCLLNIVTDQYTAENVNNCLIVNLDQYSQHRYVWFQVWKWRSLSIYKWFLQWLQCSHAANSGDTGGKTATSVQSERAPTPRRGQAMKSCTFCSPPIIRICHCEHSFSHDTNYMTAWSWF